MSLLAALAILPYALVMALLDSLLAFAFLAFVCLALPNRLFKDHCVAQGAIFFLITFIWIIPVHFQNKILAFLGWNMQVYFLWIIAWVISYLVAIFGASWLIRRNPKTEATLDSFCERLTILSNIYLCADLISLVIILWQNLA